jgi:hypothetical protein
MNDNDEKYLAEYERAQEVALHTDGIVHEITSIAWAADTLLLGFILEVECKPSNEKLVILAAVVGLAITLYVPFSISPIKVIQTIAYDICREIEKTDGSPIAHKLHSEVKKKYPTWKPGQTAVWIITFIFAAVWICVIAHAVACLYQSR